MKTIKNIDEKLQPVDIGDAVSPEEAAKQATFRKIFRLCLAVAKGTPERSLEQYDLGAKLATAAGPDIEVEDAEYRLIQDVVKQNPTDLLPHFLAQVLKRVP